MEPNSYGHFLNHKLDEIFWPSKIPSNQSLMLVSGYNLPPLQPSPWVRPLLGPYVNMEYFLHWTALLSSIYIQISLRKTAVT